MSDYKCANCRTAARFIIIDPGRGRNIPHKKKINSSFIERAAIHSTIIKTCYIQNTGRFVLVSLWLIVLELLFQSPNVHWKSHPCSVTQKNQPYTLFFNGGRVSDWISLSSLHQVINCWPSLLGYANWSIKAWLQDIRSRGVSSHYVYMESNRVPHPLWFACLSCLKTARCLGFRLLLRMTYTKTFWYITPHFQGISGINGAQMALAGISGEALLPRMGSTGLLLQLNPVDILMPLPVLHPSPGSPGPFVPKLLIITF